MTDTERIVLIVCGIIMVIWILYVTAALVEHNRIKRK